MLRAGAAGLAVFAVFCNDLSASDISSSAEILSNRRSGALNNSGICGCYSLFCGAKQPAQAS
jgi:hypothetical protein